MFALPELIFDVSPPLASTRPFSRSKLDSKQLESSSLLLPARERRRKLDSSSSSPSVVARPNSTEQSTQDSIKQYIDAGTSAVVLSDAIFDKNAMKQKDFDTICRLAALAVSKVPQAEI